MEVNISQIPHEVLEVTNALTKAGFEAWIVGGCVRDLILERKPKDWDVTTNATPEQIQAACAHTFYTNGFGTVGVVNDTTADESLKIVEVTPYRTEGQYSDSRRPDSVAFSTNIEDDLKRRDFTINALAFNPATGKLLDLYGGLKDIKDSTLKAVGEPSERFAEDALRLMRAVRLVAELDLGIEPATAEAIANNAAGLAKISRERIRDEFVRILMSPKPMKALLLAHSMGLLSYIVPELESGVGVAQNQAHSYDVFEHNLRALQHAADKDWSLETRLAALFHDVGKPKARRFGEEKGDWTFHGHEVVGARMTKKILEGLKFSRETVDKVVPLVRWHMFFSDPEKITLSAVRRIITNVGKDSIWDLVNLRICDRVGTGRPKEQPFRLRKYQSMIEQALRDPISVAMLKINGQRLIEVIGEKPGPRFGWILHALLEEVLDDPAKNTPEFLENKAQELSKLSDEHLKKLGAEGKEKKEEAEEFEIKNLRDKYHVD